MLLNLLLDALQIKILHIKHIMNLYFKAFILVVDLTLTNIIRIILSRSNDYLVI